MPKHRLLVLALAGIVLVLVPTGCEFPGPAVTVSFTSPANGQRVIGSRTLTVTGLISGTDPSAFSLTLNGTSVNLALPTAGAFSTSVTLKDGANTLVATATASGETSSATLDLYYPYLALGNGAGAALAIGQPTLDTNAASTTQFGLDGPQGAPALLSGTLYMPDTGNNRVVGLSGVPTTQQTFYFDIRLGQSSWTSSDTVPLGRTSMNAPAGVSARNGMLAVADTANNRVLLWTQAPTGQSTPPSVVLGQSGFYDATARCARVGLDHPRAVLITDQGKLLVADTGNNRVLIWNVVPTSYPSEPDYVLGQSGFDTCSANRGGATGAATLSAPGGVASYRGQLEVSDTGNNRVLVWNSIPTSSGTGATAVLGQTTMTASAPGAPGASDTGLNAPRAVSTNGNQLFVADTGNHRVLAFDLEPSIVKTATTVLGQADFSATSANRGGSTSADTLSAPQGVRVFDGMLMVADTGNARELIYRP